MNKKISLGVAISLIAVACAITFVLTMTVSLNMYNSMVAGVQERETINAKIKEIDSFVRSESIYTIDEKDISGGIMNGYVSGLKDPYAEYYSAAEYYRQQQIESGIIIGTGMITEINGDYLTVTGVYEDSSARNMGIAKGYTIVSVDGKNLLEIGALAAQELLEGEEGTKVSVKVKTTDDTEKSFTLVRQQIKLKSVESTLLDGYAYIRITTFNATTAEQFLSEIEKYEAQSVLGYVFDVRDNDTGIITGLSNMLNRILPATTAAYAEDKAGNKTGVIETDGTITLDKPIAVIVNGKTACAAELFSAALRDYSKAVLIGSVTAGKADVQSMQGFKDGSAVKITTKKAHPMESESFDGIGLKPEYVVDMTAEEQAAVVFADPATDKQLQKALEIIATL